MTAFWDDVRIAPNRGVVRVRICEEQSYTHYGRRSANWRATCDCAENLTAPDWEACMTWAYGHLCFAHPRRTWTDTELDRAYGVTE